MIEPLLLIPNYDVKYILLFVLFSLGLHAKTEAKKYHFASINYLVEQEGGRLVLPKIYQRLGISITIAPLPGKRAQYEASMGMKHGEIMRIYSYGEEAPATIGLPTPYYSLETAAFIKKGARITLNTKKIYNIIMSLK